VTGGLGNMRGLFKIIPERLSVLLVFLEKFSSHQLILRPHYKTETSSGTTSKFHCLHLIVPLDINQVE